MSNTVPFPENYCQIGLDEGTEVLIQREARVHSGSCGGFICPVL